MKYIYIVLSLLFTFGWIQSAPAGDYNKSSNPQNTDTSQLSSTPTHKIFYIVTVHIDGKTNIKGDSNHPPEPFPAGSLPEGGGVILKKPDAQGNWKIRSFIFQPSQLFVYQGDKVTLNFLGVQGPSHRLSVDGHQDNIVLKRGEMKSVTLVAGKVGTISFRSIDRQPTMQGRIVILPKPSRSSG
jgi:plastocyanin